MTAKTFNTATKRWEYCEEFGHEGDAWQEVLHYEDEAAVKSSMFIEDEYIGRGTILQRDISNMPIDPKSDEMAVFMNAATPFSPKGGWGDKTAINTSVSGTQPIHAYLVDSTHPDCNFQTWGASAIQTSQLENDLYMRGSVPQPTWAVEAQDAGGDNGLAIYDLGTGIMREVFRALKVDGVVKGAGGYSIGNPGLKDLAKTNYALQQRRGISNVAGMHNSLGFIGISEALSGKINHALCFTISAALSHDLETGEQLISYPARMSDGKLEQFIEGSPYYNSASAKAYWRGGTVTPTHGQWGRLKASVDPKYNPNTGLPYRLFTQVLIEAAKKYGVVATDTNNAVHAFNCEQGRTWAHTYGSDPWADGGIIQKKYTKPDGTVEFKPFDFPWDQVEWAPVDWGRPVPDMNLRPGQVVPWGVGE